MDTHYNEATVSYDLHFNVKLVPCCRMPNHLNFTADLRQYKAGMCDAAWCAPCT